MGRLCCPRRLGWWSCLFLAVATNLSAAESPDARLARTPGMVAVKPGDAAEWRLPGQGESIPGACQLRTGPGEPCTITLPGATLHVAAETRLRLEVAKRSIQLESGGIFLDSSTPEAWSAECGKLRAALAANSAAGLVTLADSPRVSAVRGTVSVEAGKGKPVTIDGGAAVAWDAARASLVSSPLAAADSKRLEQWTTVATPAQGLGQLLVKDPQSGTLSRLNVARYHVNVVLQPPVALVQIDQSFYNPADRMEEGTFVFNLPKGASVSRFAMYVSPSELVEGELISRQRATQVYQTIVHARRDPAILEQIGDNLFKMRVYPIFARDTKRILLDFTLPLIDDHGAYRFTLPLLSDLKPVWDFRLSGAVVGPMAADSVASQSHPAMTFKPQPGGEKVTFDFQGQNYQPPAEFSLRFAQTAADQVQLRSYVADPLPPVRRDGNRISNDPFAEPAPPSGDQPRRRMTYFIATVAPEQKAAAAPPPADVLILADTSTDTGDIVAARRAVRTVVANLRPADRFRLACVDSAVRPMHEGWCAGDGPDSRQVLARFDREFCLGASDLELSIRDAMAGFDAASKNRRMVIYVGAGRKTSSEDTAQAEIDAMAAELTGAKATFCAVVARPSEKGRPWLDSLARATGGLVFDAARGSDSSRGLFSWLLAGLPSPDRIVACQVAGAAAEDLFYPTAWLPGQPLTVLGRTTSTDRVKLVLTVAGAKQPARISRELLIDKKRDDVFIGRLWAQKKLDRLRGHDPYMLDPQWELADSKLRQQIVALSQEWSVLSPWTAFLVLESDADYSHWGIDRQQRRRYWKPADAVRQPPLSREWLAGVMPKEKPKREELTPAQFAAALRAAREALDAGKGELAASHLRWARCHHEALQSKEYAELRGRALAMARAEVLLDAAGPHRALLDPTRPVDWFRGEPAVQPLFAGLSSFTPEFLKKHPYAEKLLKPVDLPASPVAIDELVKLLAERTGANVVLQKTAVVDAGVPTDAKLDFAGWGKVSLRNYARLVLSQHNLVLVEEPHRLLITTPEGAGVKLRTELYPVADLIHTNRVADRSLLTDPYFDRQLAAEAKIHSALRRPISLEFKNSRLDRVVESLAKQLDIPIVLEGKALADAGADRESPVSASWRDVPARELLDWLLDPLDLTYTLDREALVITTPEEAGVNLRPRVLSVRGIVTAWTPPPEEPRMIFGPFVGGFGGGMGGGMGGFDGGMPSGMGMGGMGGFAGGMGMGGMMGEMPRGGRGGMPSAPAISTDSEFETALRLRVSQTQQVQSSGDPSPDFPPSGAIGMGPDMLRDELFDGPQYDFDSLIETITTQINPTTWVDAGGQGGVGIFEPTLDLVFAQTDDAFEEIKDLMERLRRLPIVEKDVQPAELRSGLGYGDAGWADSIMELIMVSVHPTTWVDAGGGGSISPEAARMALIVSQTEDVHQTLSELLIQLRRSRYEALRGQRPWETTPGAPWFAPPDGDGVLGLDPPQSKLPPPGPAELAALAVRRAAGAGAWKWQCQDADGRALETLEYLRAGESLEVRGPACIIRTQRDAAALAWPGLALVEHGNWGTAARRLLDARLPWLPHRGNDELAQWFDVRPVAQPPAEANAARLRLIPLGFAPDGGSYLEVDFNKKDGLPVRWESYLAGKLTGRLRFADRGEIGGAPVWRDVTLEDAAGKTLARWKLIEASPKEEAIPPLTEGWEGYVQLDRRGEEPAVDAAFATALRAIDQGQWAVAFVRLEQAAKSHPDHPLLLFLQVQCQEHDPQLGDQKRRIDALRRVAAGRARCLARAIADENYCPWLAPAERYAIVSLVPDRAAADWDVLARTASAAEKFDEALAHAEAALAAGKEDGRSFERQRLCVEMLLRLGRGREAIARANRWAASPRPTAEQLAVMAELLARFSNKAEADAMIAAALEKPGLGDAQRYALLRRRAGVNEGLPRWRLLLEAAALKKPDAEPYPNCLAVVLTELERPAGAEAAGVLARQAKDAKAKASLLMRQAELTSDTALAGDVLWEVHQMGGLPEERLPWACGAWNLAKQPERTIRVLEERLRTGKRLERAQTDALADAYESTGRPKDAERAATEPRAQAESPQESDPRSVPRPTPGGGMF